MWDVLTGKELHTLPALKDNPKTEPSPFTTAVLSPGGVHVAEINNVGTCRVRDVPSGKECFEIKQAHYLNLRMVRFAPDGQRLALLKSDGAVELYEVATGKLLRSLPCERHTSYYPFITFTPDGKAWLWPR